MKITIEFSEEDCIDNLHLAAIHGRDWKNVVFSIDNYLRNMIKYYAVEEKAEFFQEVRDELRGYIYEMNLTLEE